MTEHAAPRSQPLCVVAMPPHLRAQVFDPPTWDTLRSCTEVMVLDRPVTLSGLGGRGPDVAVLVTSWGQPPVAGDVLDSAPRLRLLAHAGASVKAVATPETFARGVRVTQAGAAMARPVAEVALAFTLAMLHRVHRFDHALRDGADWRDAASAPPRHELGASTIGVVGASRTGRAFLAMLRTLGAEILLHDPYVTATEAAALGARSCDLPDLLRASRVVVLHAPSLPETRHMIGEAELALIRDGGALVNVARSWLTDEAALVRELRTGRLDAALDVFDDEPLPVDSELRHLPNVLLTPHQAAGTVEGRAAMGRILVGEIQRFVATGTLEHEVTASMLPRIG